jgi:tripartite-type tricarboxylate transporter receptor subunit TctC
MKKAIRTYVLVCLATVIAVAGLPVASVHAQDFPTKPVLYLVGAGPDTVPRIMAKQFTEIWGEQVNVKQIPGAGGVIALQTLANAPADGYTFLYVTGAYTLNEALRSDMPHPPSSLGPVGQIGDIPFVVLVNPSLEVNTLQELIDYARQHPGELNCGSAGAVTTTGLGCEMLKTYAKVDVVHVPYKGFAPALTDLLAGRVQILFGLGGALTYAQDGQLRALAIAGTKRLPAFPDVPTVGEAGYPQLRHASSWSGLLVPAGTPDNVVTALNKSLNQVVESEEFQAAASKFGFFATTSSPDEFGKHIKNNLAEWKEVVADTGVSVQ